MTSSTKTPGAAMSGEKTQQKAHCNACGRITKHNIVYRKEQTEVEEIDDHYAMHWCTTYSLLECCGCEELSLARRLVCNEADEDSTEYYPPRVARKRPTWFYKLPAEYVEFLNEIYTALHADSRRLAMMGARSIIDCFISRKIGDQGSFPAGITGLVREGYISQRNAKVIEAAIEMGHASAHRGHKPSSDEINTVIDIVENLLQHEVLSESAESLKKTTPKRS